MKYELGQTVFYMKDNRVVSSTVRSRQLVENLYAPSLTGSHRELNQCFGPSGIRYRTTDGVYTESQLFATKEDLLASL